MFNPLKKVQARSRKRMQKATATAIGKMVGAMLPKPPKSKPRSKPKTSGKDPAAKGGSRPLTVTRLGQSGRAYPKIKPASATARSRMQMPKGASFQSLVHDCAFGSRDFRLYLPASAATAALGMPVLVMLHGCGQTPEDFAIGTGMNALAEELGFIIVYPTQSRQDHRNRCWNWFRRSDQSRIEGEPALLASLTQHVLATCPADPARVYIAGLSAGAAMALIVAAAYPDIFAAVGAHSGLAVGAAHDATSAILAMKHGAPGDRSLGPMPTINFHGDDDKVVHVRNGRYITGRAADAYPDLHRIERAGRTDGGHAFMRVSHRRGQRKSFIEFWGIAGLGHAWSGGSPAGRFTDPSGPDASREILRFLFQHRTTQKQRKNAGRAAID